MNKSKNKTHKKFEIKNINNAFKFIKLHYYSISIIGIFLISLLLRFYNFSNRYGLGNDDSRDVAIALEAIRRHELPLIGSFSSAGPFVFGPIFYWFLIGSYLLLPNVFSAPWIMTALSGLVTVGILIITAIKLEGKKFSLLIGLLAALSPQLVIRSLSLGQHTFVALFSSLLMLMLVMLYKQSKIIFVLLFGIILGIAINFHYQSLNLLIFLPTLLFLPNINWKRKILYLFYAILGITIGLFPLIIWDSQQQFANFRNLFDYLLIGQHRLYVPNSWKLFLFTYIPQYWSIVSGGYPFIALILMILTLLSVVLSLIKKQLNIVWLCLLVPFIILSFINKYYKGERSEGYLLYFLPLIILFTGYGIYYFWEKFKFNFFITKPIALFVIILILVGNLLYLKTALIKVSPIKEYEASVIKIMEKYPGKKFVVYDFDYRFPHVSQPLSILFRKHNVDDLNGIPLGLIYSKELTTNFTYITSMGGLSVVNLSNDSSHSAKQKKEARLSPEDMYDNLITKWNQEKLSSNFSVILYLSEKLHFFK